MPLWLSVKDVNTPIAYRGISAVRPPKPTMSARGRGKEENSVREDQTVAAVCELAGR